MWSRLWGSTALAPVGISPDDEVESRSASPPGLPCFRVSRVTRWQAIPTSDADVTGLGRMLAT